MPAGRPAAGAARPHPAAAPAAGRPTRTLPRRPLHAGVLGWLLRCAAHHSPRCPLPGYAALPAGQPEGLEFLSSRPPWKCSICNVACTSQDALMGHAAGAKHKRRVRAVGGACRCGTSERAHEGRAQLCAHT